MARALIVGCGCRGRALGERLLAEGWQVRGTTRDASSLEAIEASGIEAVLADPDRVGTVFEQLDDVSVVAWLLASARGDEDAVAALHGPRLERLLEKLIDTPVRGFVYEAAGTVAAEHIAAGRALVERARATWRIPFAFIEADPADPQAWTRAARDAVLAAISR